MTNDKPTGKDYVGSDDLYADVQRTMRLCAEMNSGYHTEAEVRDCLREITRSEVPDTVRVFPPLNINYGPGVRFGNDCFLNFGCTLLAIGGITIEENAVRFGVFAINRGFYGGTGNDFPFLFKMVVEKAELLSGTVLERPLVVEDELFAVVGLQWREGYIVVNFGFH